MSKQFMKVRNGISAPGISAQPSDPANGDMFYNTTAGLFQQYINGGWQTVGTSTSSGTVTSVAASVPAFLSISGSPITGSGTLAISYSGTALPVLNGGTGQTTLTNHGVLVGAGTSAVTQLAVGATGTILSGQGALLDPLFVAAPAFTGTNITGTATAFTASNVTTNANLTGVITSVGNATSIASQTGTGSKFVVDTSPTLVTPNLGTPSAVVLTNATGTAASLTAGTVTTNANLTGPITSSGNATSIASQTGTGTQFVMSASPTVTGTLNAATISASGVISGGGSQVGDAVVSATYSSALFDAFGAKNTNTGGLSWYFGDGTGSAPAGTFEFYNVNNSKNILSLQGSTGNVGIGTTSPNALLQVHNPSGAYATLQLTDSTLGTTYGGEFRGRGIGGSGGQFDIGALDNGTYTKLIDGTYSQGSVNIYSASSLGTSVLQFTVTSSGLTVASLAGSGSRAVNANAAGLLSASSDSRLKQEVTTATLPGLAEVLKIQPKAYKWLEDIKVRGADAAVEVGFFAEQVAPIIPSAAPMGNDGMYGFYDRSVVAALVKAVQELSAKIVVLESK